MYERQTGGLDGGGLLRPPPDLPLAPTRSPPSQESRLSPTELPFTADDFDDQLEDALELMPDILSTAEIKYAINGLLSLTPDGFPLLGETRRGAQPVVGGRDLDQGGPGRRAG